MGSKVCLSYFLSLFQINIEAQTALFSSPDYLFYNETCSIAKASFKINVDTHCSLKCILSFDAVWTPPLSIRVLWGADNKIGPLKLAIYDVLILELRNYYLIED